MLPLTPAVPAAIPSSPQPRKRHSLPSVSAGNNRGGPHSHSAPHHHSKSSGVGPSSPKKRNPLCDADGSSPTKKVHSLSVSVATPQPLAKVTNRVTTTIDTQQIRADSLGTLVSELSASLRRSTDWASFVRDFRGRSYLSEDLDDLQHPAAPLLRKWRDKGVPAGTNSQPWDATRLDHCIQRGCHPSATMHQDFL